MKKLIIVCATLISAFGYSQASSKVNNAQNFNQSVANPFNLIGANPPTDGQWQLYLKDDLRWETYNINGLASYVQSFLNWNGILGKPVFANVSFTGNYTDLINKPSIPAAQVNTDWNSSTGITQLLNKPTLSTVATSGSYVDLSNKPNIYSFSGITGQYTRGDGTYATFPTVVSAFANDAGYLTGINSSMVTTALGYTPYNGTTNPNGYITTAGARTSISAGTGISYNSTTGVVTNSAPDQTVSITGAGGNTVTGTYPDFTITGTTAKRQVTYTGTTDASGNYLITFSPSFTVAPNMQVSIANQGANTNQFVKVVSTTTTGATLNAFQRNAVTLLGIEILLAATVPVSGATIDVLVTEK